MLHAFKSGPMLISHIEIDVSKWQQKTFTLKYLVLRIMLHLVLTFWPQFSMLLLVFHSHSHSPLFWARNTSSGVKYSLFSMLSSYLNQEEEGTVNPSSWNILQFES